MKLEAVSVQRLYIQIAEQLVQLIRAGDIQPGQRLPSERDLATRFDVSRPTIREAMIALEVSNIVEVRSGSGVYVLPLAKESSLKASEDLPGPYEILEARALIEADAAALAAERMSNDELQVLGQLLRKLISEIDKGDIEAAEKIDQQFHLTIAKGSRNSALLATINWLWDLRNESQIATVFHRHAREEGSTPSQEEHQNILDAITRRDPAAARDAMTTHLERVVLNFHDYTPS
ncbi:MAG: FadR/GntR family transcriptional regulator [Halioglobus sp.]